MTTFVLKIPRQESRCIILANYRIVLRGSVVSIGRYWAVIDARTADELSSLQCARELLIQPPDSGFPLGIVGLHLFVL